MGQLRKARQPFTGEKTSIYVALGKLPPATQTVTVGTAATKGGTSIAVTGITAVIEKGNWLQFIDPVTDIEYICKVSANVAADAVSIPVEALADAIPVGAIAQFPPEFYDVSESNLERSADTDQFYTYNSGGRVTLATNTNKTWSVSAFDSWTNAGLRIVDDCFEAKKPFWLIRELEAPRDTKVDGTPVYTKGKITRGIAVCTSAATPSPADGKITADRSGEFSGAVEEIAPAVAT